MTISKWPLDPTICEINARVLLHDLSQKYGPIVDLNCAPLVEWGTVANFGFDGLWLLGVWERSPPGITIANQNEILLNDFRRPLLDIRPQDCGIVLLFRTFRGWPVNTSILSSERRFSAL